MQESLKNLRKESTNAHQRDSLFQKDDKLTFEF